MQHSDPGIATTKFIASQKVIFVRLINNWNSLKLFNKHPVAIYSNKQCYYLAQCQSIKPDFCDYSNNLYYKPHFILALTFYVGRFVKYVLQKMSLLRNEPLATKNQRVVSIWLKARSQLFPQQASLLRYPLMHCFKNLLKRVTGVRFL